jgi:hypothetical protein
VTSPTGALHEVGDLHLAIQTGDAVGFLFRTGEVDLGTKMRPRPDGAVQTFTQPCGPCGTDGGTGVELLFNAVLEPDVDTDGLGDETQDPDGGGLGEDLTTGSTTSRTATCSTLTSRMTPRPRLGGSFGS